MTHLNSRIRQCTLDSGAAVMMIAAVTIASGCRDSTPDANSADTEATAADVQSDPAAATEDDSTMQTTTIDYRHNGETFEGYLAWNPEVPPPGNSASESDDQRRPAVLVCHEWWGNNDYSRQRAEDLARLGYVAFALDMYGKGNVTSDPDQAGTWARGLYEEPAELRARARAGYDVLVKHPKVDADRIAVIGYCFGGTVALELARTGAALDAVVCFHTSGLAATNPSDNQNITGQVLVCHGDADPLVEEEVIQQFRQQMESAGVPYEFISYPGALHSFTNPAADDVGMDAVGYDEAADTASWTDMKQLFAETIDQPQASGG
ncbi:MAG: dienelactone hydrolase family protein [Planctomycetota bacterium]